MDYCFDIDGVICDLTPPSDFQNAKPNKTIIDAINNLYNKNNKIHLYTSRYSSYRDITIEWLSDNNVLYDTITFDKPRADIYVDDRCIQPIVFIDRYNRRKIIND